VSTGSVATAFARFLPPWRLPFALAVAKDGSWKVQNPSGPAFARHLVPSNVAA
jgi:hypothetical protein